MAPKFALFKKGLKLPLNKGFKNMFELLQSCTQTSMSVFCRCLLNINGLVSDQNLKLVGVTWMRATTDIYVAFQHIYINGDNASQWCTGMPGYKGDMNCPTGFSTVVHPGVIVG